MKTFIIRTGALFMLVSAIAFGRKAFVDNAWYALAIPLYCAIARAFWKAASLKNTSSKAL